MWTAAEIATLYDLKITGSQKLRGSQVNYQQQS